MDRNKDTLFKVLQTSWNTHLPFTTKHFSPFYDITNLWYIVINHIATLQVRHEVPANQVSKQKAAQHQKNCHKNDSPDLTKLMSLKLHIATYTKAGCKLFPLKAGDTRISIRKHCSIKITRQQAKVWLLQKNSRKTLLAW